MVAQHYVQNKLQTTQKNNQSSTLVYEHVKRQPSSPVPSADWGQCPVQSCHLSQPLLEEDQGAAW
jgi:hypothetical protein